MTVLGEVYGKPERAVAYHRHFDETIERVAKALALVEASRRPTVLYFQPSTR